MTSESDTELLRTKLEPKLIQKVSDTLGIKLGQQWRLVEGPYPSGSSPACIQMQVRKGTEWTTVAAHRPDGTDALGCMAIYATATAQTITNTATTTINYNSRSIDTDNAVSVGTSWRFTTPAGKGGFYMCVASTGVGFPLNTALDTLLSVFVNGTEATRGVRQNFTSNAGGAFVNLLVSGVLILKPGDTVSIGQFQNSGANRTLDGFGPSNVFQIYRISFY